MPLIALFEEVAALVLNKSVPEVGFSKVLRARHNKGHSCLQARHCHSYVVNILSPLWAWKISIRGTEGKKLTGITWYVWYPFLGNFYTHDLLRSRALHLRPFPTTTQPCSLSLRFPSNSPIPPVFRKDKREESPSESAATAKSSSWEMGFWTRLRTKPRLLTRWMPQLLNHHIASGQFCLLQAEFLK